MNRTISESIATEGIGGPLRIIDEWCDLSGPFAQRLRKWEGGR